MSGQQQPGVASEAADDSVADEVTVTIDGAEITISRAKVAALAGRIAASPDGEGTGSLFAFMAGLPGSELASEQEIGPKGPGPRPDPKPEPAT